MSPWSHLPFPAEDSIAQTTASLRGLQQSLRSCDRPFSPRSLLPCRTRIPRGPVSRDERGPVQRRPDGAPPAQVSTGPDPPAELRSSLEPVAGPSGVSLPECARGHQAIGVHGDPEPFDHLFQRLQKPLAVGIIAHDRLTFIAACRHVIHRVREFPSNRPCHDAQSDHRQCGASSVKS